MTEPIDLDAIKEFVIPNGGDVVGLHVSDWDAVVAELRAARKVVENAGGVQLTAHHNPEILYRAVVQQWWVALTSALADYEASQ